MLRVVLAELPPRDKVARAGPDAPHIDTAILIRAMIISSMTMPASRI